MHRDKMTLFEAGLAVGLDPDGQPPGGHSDAVGTRRPTTLRSRWLHRRCLACGHSFRLGDEVALRPDGWVLHDMPGLRCAGGEATMPPDPTAQRNFFAGLDAAWPLPDDITPLRLEAGHDLLAPPYQGHARASCRICGHTFRPGDQVIICPCSPEAPKCRAAVHRDTLHQLHCWDEWIRERSEPTCLGMS